MAKAKAQSVDATSDGRRQRSLRSREKIIESLFALIRAGDPSPSAASVAGEAGVGIRTVFRIFEDLDSLYAEMSERVAAEVLPQLQAPFTAPDWRGRLAELLDRRVRIYEQIFPMRVSASLRRYQSSFLKDEYERFIRQERDGLLAVLPDSLKAEQTRVAALDAAISFTTWRRLRQDQQLSVQAAADVVRLTVDALVDGC